MNGYRYLTLADREKLETLYLAGERVQDIADEIRDGTALHDRSAAFFCHIWPPRAGFSKK